MTVALIVLQNTVKSQFLCFAAKCPSVTRTWLTCPKTPIFTFCKPRRIGLFQPLWQKRQNAATEKSTFAATSGGHNYIFVSRYQRDQCDTSLRMGSQNCIFTPSQMTQLRAWNNNGSKGTKGPNKNTPAGPIPEPYFNRVDTQNGLFPKLTFRRNSHF